MSYFDLFKTAAQEPAAQEEGTLHRRKAKKRGFYTDPSPGIYGMRAAFESAERKAGKLAALQNFGLLHGKDDPVKGLTELYKTDDFGLPRKGSRKPRASASYTGSYTSRGPHMSYNHSKNAAAAEALRMFKVAGAPVGMIGRAGAAIGGGISQIGGAAQRAVNVAGKLFNRGSNAAAASGSGAVGQFLGGAGHAISGGATVFHRAGGTAPLLAGVAGAGALYGAGRATGLIGGSQPQGQKGMRPMTGY